MWYFELQPDYTESTYTPEVARTFVLLSTHVKTTYTPEVARTFVLLSTHVKTAVYQGMVM